MKKTWFFAALAVGWAMLSSISLGYSGGSGTPQLPYQIADANDLLELAADTGNYDKCFILTEDIDLEGQVFANAIIAPDTDNTVWGFQGIAFTGVFDGNGHVLRNITIDTGSTGKGYLGLFGVIGTSATGGVIKNLGVEDITITNIPAHGFECTGGLAGAMYPKGTIMGCYTTGIISGNHFVGGLIGGNGGTIVNCYSITDVFGYSDIGGLAGGDGGGKIVNCYSTGAVSGSRESGGLVSGYYSLGKVIHCFWDVQTSGMTTSGGGRGKTTTEMKQAATFLGWNCGQIVWKIDDGNDYPRLLWESKPGAPIPGLTLADFMDGSGEPNNPYLISTAEQLSLLGNFNCEMNKYFLMTADIDLTGYDSTNFTLLGQSDDEFTGSFDGNGYTIFNFSYTDHDFGVGLFGNVGTEAIINNLRMMNVNISGGIAVGGLAGTNGGTIIHCSVNGSVAGSVDVGGLAGTNGSGGIIIQCKSEGSVSSRSFEYPEYCVGEQIGGLVGSNISNGFISNSYSSSSVTSQCVNAQNLGGLVGENYISIVTQCYSTGPVNSSLSSQNIGGLIGKNQGSIDYSFWDIETSGQTISAGGVGKTTAEMKTLATFTAAPANWDFTNETVNGTNDYWRMCVNNVDYPRLNWESIDGDFACPDGVNTEDLDYFAGRWMLNNCTSSNNYCGGVDMDASSVVNLVDFSIFAQHWLEEK